MNWADLRKINRACQLGSGHKTVLLTLATYMDARGRAHPSRETLSGDTGLSDRRLRELINDLVEAGFLAMATEVVSGMQMVVYTLAFPSQDGTENALETGEISPEAGEISPKIGGISPVALIRREDTRRYKEGETARAPEVAPLAAENVTSADLAPYRGTMQPLARLAWAERCARWHVEEVMGQPSGACEELRAAWMAFLVQRAEKGRANQAPMLSVDAAAQRVRELLQAGGVAYAVEAVNYALAAELRMPVGKPAAKGLTRVKVESELMRSYAGTAKTVTSLAGLEGFGA